MQPLLFGTVYAKTVAVFPRAVFALAGAILVVPLVTLCFVRPSPPGAGRKKAVARVGGDEVQPQVERGRSRASKDLGWSSYNGGSTVLRLDTSTDVRHELG